MIWQHQLFVNPSIDILQAPWDQWVLKVTSEFNILNKMKYFIRMI